MQTPTSTKSQTLGTGSTSFEQQRSIKVGQFVCCEEKQIFDAQVKEVGDTELTVVTENGKEHKLEKTDLGEGQSFTGPRLMYEDLGSGKEIEFKLTKDAPDLRGQIAGQSNTEVCVRQINGDSDRDRIRKSQLWIPRENIRFLYVMVFSASSLKNADIGLNNKSDPYVKVHLRKSRDKPNASTDDLGAVSHHHEPCEETHHLNDDLDPIWNTDFKFISVRDVEAVEFWVWDKDVNVLKSDDFLGCAELTKEKWEAGEAEILELPLLDMDKKKPIVDAKESKLKVRVKMCGGPKD